MQQIVMNQEAVDILSTFGISEERKTAICDILTSEISKTEDDPEKIYKEAIPNILNQMETDNEKIFISMNVGVYLYSMQQNPLEGLLSMINN